MARVMTFPIERLETAWQSIGTRHPLVYQLTNGVAMPEQAHVALAVGASPIMSLCTEEAEDFAKLADATLVNTGTPTPGSGDVFARAVRAANEASHPVVLDPVGYGANPFRNRLVESLLDSGRITVVKGNASEMCLLAGQEGSVRGVDRGLAPNPAGAVLELARKRNVIAVATGETDWLSDGKRTWAVNGGDPMLESFSGSGCWLGTLVAACIGASGDPLGGTLAALCAFGTAAESARQVSRGPGSFRANLLDVLHELAGPCAPFFPGRVREIRP
jgi:hydroxyethylthiazole kinase